MATAKKSFVLELDTNLDENHKKWTKEAIEKFISLFPEFADNFDIQFGQNEFLEQALDANGRLDFEKWGVLMQQKYRTQTAADPVRVAVTPHKTTLGFGYSCGVGVCVSAGQCGNDEEYFKDIVMHELGHAFNATHEGRANIVNNLGEHCTDQDCLMYEYAYQTRFANRRKGKDNPFCNDCMEAMRDFMENSLHLNKNTQITVDNDEQRREYTHPLGDEFKQNWRNYAQKVAIRLNATMTEDEQSPEFMAVLKQQDGAEIKIIAHSASSVSLSAKDKNNSSCTPNMAVFKELVAKAQKSKQTISFGNIKSPEFKARLLIACMEANPPVATNNAPQLNEEFLNAIDATSASTLKILQNKLQTQQQKRVPTPEQTPQPTPTPQIQPQPITGQNYLATLSAEEKSYLRAYSTYLHDNNIRRRAEDIFWDKMMMVASMRFAYNSTNAYPPQYLKPDNLDFEAQSQANWKQAVQLNNLHKMIYQASTVGKNDDELNNLKQPETKENIEQLRCDINAVNPQILKSLDIFLHVNSAALAQDVMSLGQAESFRVMAASYQEFTNQQQKRANNTDKNKGINRR